MSAPPARAAAQGSSGRRCCAWLRPLIVLIAVQLGPALLGLKTFSGVDILTAVRALG